MCGCFVLASHWWFALNNGPPFLAIYWPLCKRTLLLERTLYPTRWAIVSAGPLAPGAGGGAQRY